jgi:hypothetical protein
MELPSISFELKKRNFDCSRWRYPHRIGGNSAVARPFASVLRPRQSDGVGMMNLRAVSGHRHLCLPFMLAGKIRHLSCYREGRVAQAATKHIEARSRHRRNNRTIPFVEFARVFLRDDMYVDVGRTRLRAKNGGVFDDTAHHLPVLFVQNNGFARCRPDN